MVLIWSLFVFVFTSVAVADPAPYPIFLKPGFSSVLEFDKAPSKVVLGDAEAFQIERLESSIVIRPKTDDAVTNLFVYFEKVPPKMFLLRSSSEADPALYRKFQAAAPPRGAESPGSSKAPRRASAIRSVSVDPKKEFVLIEAEFIGTGRSALRPSWNSAKLKIGRNSIAPTKTWVERREIPPGAAVRARFTFEHDRVPEGANGSMLVIPMGGGSEQLILPLKVSK